MLSHSTCTEQSMLMTLPLQTSKVKKKENLFISSFLMMMTAEMTRASKSEINDAVDWHHSLLSCSPLLPLFIHPRRITFDYAKVAPEKAGRETEPNAKVSAYIQEALLQNTFCMLS